MSRKRTGRPNYKEIVMLIRHAAARAQKEERERKRLGAELYRAAEIIAEMDSENLRLTIAVRRLEETQRANR